LKKRTVVLLALLAMIGGSVLTMALTGSGFITQAASGQAALLEVKGGLNKEEAKKIGAALDLIQSNYYQDVDRSKLLDGAINGMMESLDDPYSSYMGKQTAEDFEETISGSFSGIGAEVSSEDGNVVVVSPIKGSPAEKAGIRAKDIIMAVNGVSLHGLKLNDAVAKIRGPKGSEAKLTIKRSGSASPIEYTILRADVDLETVKAHMEPGKIGVIEITQFSLNTAERFKQELSKLESEGMEGLVIDVRNNPGGVLSVVIDIAEQFVPKGKMIVQVEDKNKKRDGTLSKGSGKSYPVTLLMNKGSASASEILAGALQQSAGAKLMGDNSFGKGTVQTSFTKQFDDGSLLKITIAKWLTPNGSWIHKKGLQPDIAVAQPDYFSVAPINKETTQKYNMNNADVKSAQIMLDALGYKPGRKDGFFDEKTVSGVKSFQKEQKLSENGNIDTKTAEALETALIKQIRDPKNDNQLKAAIAEVQKEIAAAASKH
jgi:carboxyl-terminal processing protease